MEALLFGSAARGMSDWRSDYDILVALPDASRVDRECIAREVTSRVGRRAGISVYGMGRLKAMWSEGSPFAWHLYLEAKPVPGFEFGILKALGKPVPYLDAFADSKMMADMLVSIVRRASAGVASACYEAGLLYVCSRNIAMFASKSLLGRFDFSRTAPFAISKALPFPLSYDEYDILIAARHAATRGSAPPRFSTDCLVVWSTKLVAWASEGIAILQDGEIENEF